MAMHFEIVLLGCSVAPSERGTQWKSMAQYQVLGGKASDSERFVRTDHLAGSKSVSNTARLHVLPNGVSLGTCSYLLNAKL